MIKESNKFSSITIWRDGIMGLMASMGVGLLTSLLLALTVFLGVN